MAVRTTPTLVQGILEVESGKDLTPFIRSANVLVNGVCGDSGYTDGDPDAVPPVPYEDTEMELIERWLAAHFYTIYDNQLSQAGAGSVRASFQHDVDLLLFNSMYGQQAVVLDYHGNLAALQNQAKTRRKVVTSISWLGTVREWPNYRSWSDYSAGI